jgi:hypothetical protein
MLQAGRLLVREQWGELIFSILHSASNKNEHQKQKNYVSEYIVQQVCKADNLVTICQPTF